MAPRLLRRAARSARNFGPTWRYLFNLRPTLAYSAAARRPSAEALRVLEALDRDGVAISSAAALLGEGTCYGELCDEAWRLEERLAPELERARAAADDEGAVGAKTFFAHLLGERPVLDPESVFARFALEEQVLGIANAYFGMYTRLRYYNVWHTFATRGRPRESQLWHRDREDLQILKLFLYLSDVDEGAGPLCYAAGSHAKGTVHREPESFAEAGVRRSDDRQMGAVVPPERWVTATGPRGTLVFADTHGYHKGGLARERDRVLYTCMYTSAASQSPEMLERREAAPPRASRSQAFALA